MAEHFVRNINQPVPSVSPHGVRITAVNPDAVPAAYKAAGFPLAAGDQLEVLPAAAISAYVAVATFSFSPGAVTPLPPVNT